MLNYELPGIIYDEIDHYLLTQLSLQKGLIWRPRGLRGRSDQGIINVP
jgi:hypothetical protein